MVRKLLAKCIVLILAVRCQGRKRFGAAASEAAEANLQNRHNENHHHPRRIKVKRKKSSNRNKTDPALLSFVEKTPSRTNDDRGAHSSDASPKLMMQKYPRRLSTMASEAEQHSAPVEPKQFMRREGNTMMSVKHKKYKPSGMQSRKSRRSISRFTSMSDSPPHSFYNGYNIHQVYLDPPEPADYASFYPTATPTTLCTNCLSQGSCEPLLPLAAHLACVSQL